MDALARRRKTHEELMRIGELARSANSFGLFRTGNSLERIQRELAHFHALPEELKRTKAERILERAEKAEARLEDEHSDVALASGRKWRGRRGLIASCALLAAQMLNLAALIIKPWFTPDFIERYHPNIIAGAVILSFAVFPIRDFLFAYRFDKLKEKIGTVLQEVKNGIREERDKKVI